MTLTPLRRHASLAGRLTVRWLATLIAPVPLALARWVLVPRVLVPWVLVPWVLVPRVLVLGVPIAVVSGMAVSGVAVSGMAVPGRAWAGPVADESLVEAPPVIRDTQAPITCTVTFMVTDTANGDLFAQRIRVPPAETDQAVDHRMPCSPDILPRLAGFARDACTIRAADARTCVYTDMGRAFSARPEITNTDVDASRCTSDTASEIAASCWMKGVTPICNVGCGATPAEALSRARARCQDKQQRPCTASAILAVTDQLAPSPDAPPAPSAARPVPAPPGAARSGQ
ncbi:hypothetical protein [Rhodopila sp.]|uniref:hypothetical protein n=1 Tax=Rhodopila sp. TaxID=2480087 RepID=UPI002CB8BEC9|nr:hypothetical protein [Rhodopila sp.]HVZ10327.1 hypothetical protein [Rhodopila sp.]